MIVTFVSRVSANTFLPESPIMLYKNNDKEKTVKPTHFCGHSRFNPEMDELTFNASAKDVAPESPILLYIGCNQMTIIVETENVYSLSSTTK